MTGRPLYLCVLVLVGAAWGLSMPLTKIAVSTGYQHFGLLLWQLVIGALMLSLVGLLRRKRLPTHGAALRTYLIIALVGAVVPNSISYQAAVHLPSGILSILISMVPIMAFPFALLLAQERFEWRRLVGLGLGFAAVVLLIVPGGQMSGNLSVFWMLATLFATVCYGFEGNYVARWGTAGCDALEVLWGATLTGIVIVLPLALISGHFIQPESFGKAEQAQVMVGVLSISAYTGYVWLVGRAGPVFTVQVSYLVTLFGVGWALLLLGERYPGLVWLALILMLVGISLVQPRRSVPAP